MSSAAPFAERDALERRYDGPVPPADPAEMGRPPALGRVRLLHRLAAETVAETARRRGRLDASATLADTRLPQLGRTLLGYRCLAASWLRR